MSPRRAASDASPGGGRGAKDAREAANADDGAAAVAPDAGSGKRRRRTKVGASADALDAPGFLLWQASNRWQRQLREALRETELTHVQLVLLEGIISLARDDEPVTQARLAAHARTDTMMTSQVVRELERRALLERTAHPSDRRARQLVTTAHGRALAARARPIVERVDADFFAPLGDKSPKFIKRLRLLGREEA